MKKKVFALYFLYQVFVLYLNIYLTTFVFKF